MQIPFAAQSYQSRSLPLSAQRLVNGYTQASEGKDQPPVFRTAGVAAFATLPYGIRNAIDMNGTLIVVSGPSVYSVSSTGAITLLGTVSPNGTVSMAHNGTQTVVVSGGLGYVVTGAVVQIADPDFRAPLSVVWVDGYFVFLAEDGTTFASDLNNPTSYDALAYDQTVGEPSGVLSLLVDHRDVFHFKEHSLEIWYNKGTIPMAFGRATDGFVERGCGAARSPAKLDNTVFWLADDLTVRTLRGNVPTRISTDVIEQDFTTYGVTSDAIGFTISHDGRFSYVLTFPTAGRTWEYSVATQLWNERASQGQTSWQVEGVIQAFGKTLAWAGTQLGRLDPLTYAEWGEPLVMRMTSKTIADGPNWVFHQRLEIDCEVGSGIATGQGSDPQLMLRYSDDGRNWSPEYWRPAGKAGKYRTRAVWNRLGRSRNRIYELSISDPVPFVFYGAYLNEEQSIAA